MSNFGPLLRFPEAPAPAVTYPLTKAEAKGAELLEVRTEAGTVYVRPSRWQRIRLQWTFRHFRVLPPQVLSRSDRRLIEKLTRSAVVSPALPVRRNTVFGVVDQVRSKPPVSATRVATLRTERVRTQVFLTKPMTANAPTPDLSVKPKEAKGAAAGFKDWGVLPAAVCIAVIFAIFSRIPFLSKADIGVFETITTPTKHAANQSKPAVFRPAPIRPLLASATTVSLANLERPRLWVGVPRPKSTLARQESAPPEEGSSQSASVSHSPVPGLAKAPSAILEPVASVPRATAQPRFVSELPEGGFAHPVVSEPNLVGELQLKALIGADGSVKDVTVLSGDPRLAEAAMRAVRQWHYSPDQLLGGSAEVETRIKMNFFGQDAVSIASVANKGQAEGTVTAP
jgi:hypothetical protein